MCTLVLLYKMLEEYPVFALHNRYLGLNTIEKPPQNFIDGIFCPVDVESNGTWIGLNREGLFIGITNQETQVLKNPTRSRGLLALDVLRKCVSSDDARDYLMDPSIRNLYRTGNFIIADEFNAYHVLWDSITKSWNIKPGPYAIGTLTIHPNVILDDRANRILEDSERRRNRAVKLLKNLTPKTHEEAIEKMKKVSSDHEYGKTTSSICWHSKEYKQTSSTIFVVCSNPLNSKVSYCIGNACESPFNEFKVSFD
jgi:uncharacterized protein with NRDE domain